MILQKRRHPVDYASRGMQRSEFGRPSARPTRPYCRSWWLYAGTMPASMNPLGSEELCVFRTVRISSVRHWCMRHQWVTDPSPRRRHFEFITPRGVYLQLSSLVSSLESNSHLSATKVRRPCHPRSPCSSLRCWPRHVVRGQEQASASVCRRWWMNDGSLA